MKEGVKILVIIHKWPSKEHPYLVHLFSKLKERFPEMELYILNRVTSVSFAETMIGKENLYNVLKSAKYPLKLSLNPFEYFSLIARFLRFPLEFSQLYLRFRSNGYSLRKTFGQILPNFRLVGKNYNLVYVNALQTARHFSLDIFFPNSKIIASSRGQDFDLHPSAYDHVLKQLDHLHVLGEYLQKRSMDRSFLQEKITRIPPAVLPLSFNAKSNNNFDTGKVRIISVSRLYWTKGYVFAIRAIKALSLKVPQDSFEYVIVGDGPMRQELMLEVERLELKNVITFTGWLSQGEVDMQLAKSDVFMLLSIEEAFNNATMQAQQVGLPCIVANTGGLPENVLSDETGFVVPRYDETATAKALERLVIDKSLRDRLGLNAKERMQKNFNLEKQVASYVEMFNKVIGKY